MGPVCVHKRLDILAASGEQRGGKRRKTLLASVKVPIGDGRMWENTLIEIYEIWVEAEMLKHLLAKWSTSILKGNFPHLCVECFSHSECKQEDKKPMSQWL
jgi:hypothetical protein